MSDILCVFVVFAILLGAFLMLKGIMYAIGFEPKKPATEVYEPAKLAEDEIYLCGTSRWIMYHNGDGIVRVKTHKKVANE